VYTARGEGRLGGPDREHLSYSVENDWILVTFDDDFLSLVESSGFEHAGMFTFSRPDETSGMS
jgi:predicted nuclease of predicted toxin-antitoxin system